MATVRTFCCLRPAPNLASQVAALPYDVYNREEAAKAVANNAFSFLNIDRAETQFDKSVDTYDEKVYLKAKELLDTRIKEDVFIKDSEPAYYIYELTMNGRMQTGLVACCSIDDYCDNLIKKHENTRADKEQDRIHHVDTCNAQTGPIFLAYRNNAIIHNAIEMVKQSIPIYDFISEDKIIHKVWKIADNNLINTIQKEFAAIQDIYIADGHHRAASAVKVGLKRRKEHPDYTGSEEFNYFLSVLFPDEELMIMPYNRVVKDLNGLTNEEFLHAIEKDFTLEQSADPISPKEKGSFGMLLGTQWYLLKARRHILSADSVDGLDVSILQNNLLTPILGIHDPKTDNRIDFVGGIRGLEELERRISTDMSVAFSMYSTSIHELFAVADANKLMPPKSTWFEPKLRSGIFIHEI